MISRRKALAAAGAFLVTAACRPDDLFGPRCTVKPTLVEPSPVSRRDVFITDSGSLTDTSYPARSAAEFDALLDFLKTQDSLAVHFKGSFRTKGCYRWGQFASRNLGKNWTVDGDAELALDPDSITDVDAQPLYCLAGPANLVTGITTIGNHTALAPRWGAKTLRTGGVVLYGDSRIDAATFKNFGAVGAETFVAEIVGSGPITNNLYTDHDPSSSDDQVTVFRTLASENGEATSDILSVHEHNTVNVPGSRKVQAHCIYQSPGLVRFNKSIGADVFYYADYWNNRDVKIEENDAIDSIHGVQLKLSPTAGDNTELPKYFSHEQYTIGWNRFGCSGAQVSLDTCGPSTDTRFIRDIRIHPDLSVENVNNGATGVRRELSCRMAAA